MLGHTIRIKGLHSQMCFTQFPTQSLHSSLKKKTPVFSVYILNVNLLKKKKKRPITCSIFITYGDLMFLTILIMEKLF